MRVVDENGFSQQVVIADDMLQTATVEIHDVGTGLHRKRHGGGCRLMKEIRIVPDGGFLTLDMTEQCLHLHHPGGVRFTPQPGLFKIPPQGSFLDLECIEPSPEFKTGRQADFFDFPLQSFQFHLRLLDLSRKQRRIFRDSFHDS